MKVTHGSLFSGIGGIDLGFEWAGIETRWQVEIDEYCQKLLSVRFPHTKKFTDVRKVGSHNLEKVDIISGGFPCQDISVAGKGAGIEGERSGLWTELHRIISELRPRFAFIENVPMLTIRGGTRVISDLAEIGYDAEWQTVGADDVGAWHRRKRIWIVAYPRDSSDTAIKRQEKEKDRISEVNRTGRSSGEFSRTSGSTKVLADTNRTGDRTSKSRTNRDRQKEDERRKGQSQSESGRYSKDVPDTLGKRGCSGDTAGKDAEDARQLRGSPPYGYWDIEPDVGRLANGIPSRVDRLKGIGNAVVPHIPYIIGKRLYELCQENQAEKH